MSLRGQRPAGANTAVDGTRARRGSPVPLPQGVRTRSRSSPAERCSVCVDGARSAGHSATRARGRLDLADYDATGARPGTAPASRRALCVMLVREHGGHACHAAGRGHQHGGSDERLGCQRRPNGFAGRAHGHSPGATTTSTMPGSRSDHSCEHRGGRRRREHRRERLQIVAACRDRRGEHGAPCTIAQVGAQPPAAKHAAVSVGDRSADLLTHHRATLRELHQGAPCLEDCLLCRADRRLERDRDLLVREPTELAHHQRTPLPIGQLPQIRDQQRQTRPLAGTILRRANAPLRNIGELAVAAASTNQRNRLVVRDPKQPRT